MQLEKHTEIYKSSERKVHVCGWCNIRVYILRLISSLCERALLKRDVLDGVTS